MNNNWNEELKQNEKSDSSNSNFENSSISILPPDKKHEPDRTISNNEDSSSSLAKFIGILGKSFGNISKGIGSGIGTISKGIGKGIGSSIKSLGFSIGSIGKGIETMGKRLDMLGKGLNNLRRFGLDQLGKGLKDIRKELNLRVWQKKMKKKEGVNSSLLTGREKKIQFVKGHLKRSDTIAAILALICLILSYYENDDFYNAIKDPITNEIIKPGNTSTPLGNAIRGSIIVMTGAMMVCVCLNYHFKLEILKLKRLILEEDNLYTAGLIPKLAFELFICSICCPPYFDYSFEGYVLSGKYVYSYDAIINVVTILKSYLVLRTYQHYSTWNNERAIRTCKKMKCNANVRFAIKAELKRRPYIMLGIIMLFTIVYLGLAMRTFEISYVENGNSKNTFDFSFLANNMWLIIITMTTVGLGEGYPSTHLGRFIGVCACLIGMLLISLMVVSLTLSSEFTPEESKAFFILKRIHANDNAKDKAANVLKNLFHLRHNINKSNDPSGFTQRFVWMARLKKSISVFANDYKIANSHNLPVDEMLKNLQDKFESDINDIKEELKTIPDINEKCADIKDRQVKISENLNNIIKMQSVFGEYLVSLNNQK